MWRGTSSATPGYSIFYSVVCGHSCGQSGVSARFDQEDKSRKRPRSKAFRASLAFLMDGRSRTPKPPVPTRCTASIIQLFHQLSNPNFAFAWEADPHIAYVARADYRRGEAKPRGAGRLSDPSLGGLLDGCLQALLVGLDHLLDHLAAHGASLPGAEVAVVALLQVDAHLL